MFDAVDPEWDAILFLEGQLTWPHVRQFQTEMDRYLNGGKKKLCLDLRDLTYLDSSGLAAFVPVHTKFENAGGHLVLRYPRKLIYHVFASAHLDTVLDVRKEPSNGGVV